MTSIKMPSECSEFRSVNICVCTVYVCTYICSAHYMNNSVWSHKHTYVDTCMYVCMYLRKADKYIRTYVHTYL